MGQLVDGQLYDKFWGECARLVENFLIPRDTGPLSTKSALIPLQ